MICNTKQATELSATAAQPYTAKANDSPGSMSLAMPSARPDREITILTARQYRAIQSADMAYAACFLYGPRGPGAGGASIHQRHDIRHFPKACLDTSGHRGRDAKRSVMLHEIVEHEVQGQHVKVVRGLLAMRSSQPREAAHMVAPRHLHWCA